MRINYRPEIDGLRAIAVGAVIIYHAEIIIQGSQLFKGGYIGVDIFFVISGYLISSIIFRELEETKSFSFKYFYERRIRRIIPVLIFVIITSIPIAWFVLSPIELVDYSKSILYTLGFSSNLYFHFSGQEYAALSGLYKPFLHSWSLSVEEQYYAIFPIIILIIFKFYKKFLINFLFLIFFSSLLLSEMGSKNFSSLNFYILPTRMWEILIGTFVAYYKLDNKYQSKLTKINYVFPSFGLILIFYSFLFFDHSFRHPSLYTLLPIIGVLLIICFPNKNEIVNKILSSKLFVGIGLISYSLYLWHYPVFAFARITEITSGNFIFKILLGLLILFLSIFSYIFIEKKFRDKKNNFKNILILLTTFLFLIFFFCIYVISKNGINDRMPKYLQNVTYNETHKLLKNSKNIECLQNKDGCVFNKNSNKKVFLIGDSHAASIGFDLKNNLIKKNYKLITSLMGDCGFFPDFDLIDIKFQQIDTHCNKNYFKNLQEKLMKNKNSIIIFSAKMPLYINNLKFDISKGNSQIKWKKAYISENKRITIQKSFKNLISSLSKENKIILIYPIPEMGVNISRKLLNEHLSNKFNLKKNNIDNHNFNVPFEVYKIRSKSTFDLYNSINNKNIYRIYPHKVLCDEHVTKNCFSFDDENIYYFDEHHLSVAGSKKINENIIRLIDQLNK